MLILLLWILERVVTVGGFAFDPALHHRHQLKTTAGAPDQTSMGKCPFRRILSSNVFKKKKELPVQQYSPTLGVPPLQYNNEELQRASSSSSSIAKIGLMGSGAVPFPESEGSLTPMEQWCVDKVEQWYSRALSIKCPFFRRRASDLLDAADMLMRFLVVRNESLLGPPPSLRGVERGMERREKTLYLSREELMEAIRKDWRQDTNKGYYCNGRLSTNIYRDDCLFDGPDPDMPVKGLRKYLNAASQLFDQKTSRAELLSLQIENDVIVARWRFNGNLRLPWRPRMPEVVGKTVYHTDPTGLIYKHEESWDMSAYEAFFWTMVPQRFSPAFRAVKRHMHEALLFV